MFEKEKSRKISSSKADMGKGSLLAPEKGSEFPVTSQCPGGKAIYMHGI